MKKNLVLLFIILISIDTNAQMRLSTSTIDPKTKARIFLRNLLLKHPVTNNLAAKTTVLRERLIGQSDYAPAYIMDSMAFTYSGQHGSTFSLQFLSYTQGVGCDFFPIGSNIIFGYASGSGLALSHNQGLCVLSDSTIIMSVYPFTGIYGPWANETHSYDVNNNLLDDAFMGIPTLGVIWQRDICTYNTANNVTTILQLANDPSTGSLPWDTTYLAVFTYNGANQMVIDSECTYNTITHGWQPQSKYTYSYDGSGNMIFAQLYQWGSSWQLLESYTMTYYGGTQSLQTFEYDMYTPTPVILSKDSLGYTPGVSYFTYSKDVQYTSGVLSDMNVATKHVNLSGLPDTINSYDYGTGTTVLTHQIGRFVYNSYNDPTTYYSWTDTSAPFATEFFYYELYNANAVPTVVVENNIKIYPNPATNKVYISSPGFTKNIITVTILNSLGQKIRTETLPWQNETEQISVYDLLPGTYWIVVSDNQNILHSERIVKL